MLRMLRSGEFYYKNSGPNWTKDSLLPLTPHRRHLIVGDATGSAGGAEGEGGGQGGKQEGPQQRGGPQPGGGLQPGGGVTDGLGGK